MLGLLMTLFFVGHFNRASIMSTGDERILRRLGIPPGRLGWNWGIGARAVVGIGGAFCGIRVRAEDARPRGIRTCSPAPPR